MFSGLIQEMAVINSFSGDLLALKSQYQPKIGDSIAVNGACLTVVSVSQGGFCLQLSTHTQQSIALENYRPGLLVHMEPALRASDRLDGHLVQGHVDGIGVVLGSKAVGNQVCMQIKAPDHILELCIPKGSIAIDGVSLTLASIGTDFFELVIIEHTFKNTLFSSYKKGRRVNIESDMLVRSIAHFLRHTKNTATRDIISWQEMDALVMGY
ncbi:riboflavin synthase [Helicobacter suis]|uniref:riboflavin synthase n=1 Tax=Helicobacter suis TaxID=104628 RepID=UPI0013D56195|nr:riboflavin synthase [Helicobacter suis]